MSNNSASVDRTMEAFRLSSDILMDLHGAMQVYRAFQKSFAARPAKEPVPTQVNRICAFHAVLALDKWVEFYNRYAAVLPVEMREVALELKKIVENKGIPKFRDEVVGHIWSRDANRPLTPVEVDRRFNRIAPEGLDTFMQWICDCNGPTSAATAAGAVEMVRNAIGASAGFSDKDLREQA
ncbi:MAG: hypothetical protein R3E65_01015 [Steroidobacteraceae bacterium]